MGNRGTVAWTVYTQKGTMSLFFNLFESNLVKFQICSFIELKMKQLKNRNRDFPCILSKKFAVKKQENS